MTHKVTSTQPEPVRQKIYGGQPVEPFASANQPDPQPNVKVHGQRRPAIIRVKLQGGEREMIIREADFDADRHVRLD